MSSVFRGSLSRSQEDLQGSVQERGMERCAWPAAQQLFVKSISGVGPWRRERWNPIGYLEKARPQWPRGHIMFDPSLTMLRHQYCRVEQCTDDGTWLFFTDLMDKLLVPLVNQLSYATNRPPNLAIHAGIRYRVGMIHIARVFGQVHICDGMFPGQRTRVRMPVACEYVDV